MASYNKINDFVQDIGEEVHDLASDQLVVALTNTAVVATNGQLSDLTSVIVNTNLGGAGAFDITTTSWTNTSGTSKLILADLTLTATGSAGPFRYIAIYNDDAANDELIGWYDYGSSVTLTSSDTFTLNFDGSAGVLTIT